MVDQFVNLSQRDARATRGLAHLLLVDDDPALLDALSGTLRSRLRHITLDTCDSGTKALDLVRGSGYDTIIVDFNMPNMNGLQLLTAVKELRPETPVLMISAHADHGMMAKALAAGATDFIAKPFDRDEFVRAVRHGLGLSRLQSLAVNLEERHRKTSKKLGMIREKLHQHVLRKLKDTHH